MTLLERMHRDGQSIWLDDLSRDLIEGGVLTSLRDDAGIGGITANPTIIAKAIADGAGYDEFLADRTEAAVNDPESVFWELATNDVREAADIFRDRYDSTDGRDGLVSLEVSPTLADDAEATIDLACSLFEELDRPNVMIKVPGTPAGVIAIEELTARGVNVNVTLLFGLEQFRAAGDAYLQGLHRRLGDGKPVHGIRSVASFFLSRIDVKANERLPADLHNQLAVALARLAYDHWLAQRTLDQRWTAAAREGASPQRLLWASVSSKDPQQSATDYPERLIAPETVITAPRETLDAARHAPESDSLRLDRLDVGRAQQITMAVTEHGIDLDELADELQVEGVEKFAASWEELLGSIADSAPAARSAEARR